MWFLVFFDGIFGDFLVGTRNPRHIATKSQQIKFWSISKKSWDWVRPPPPSLGQIPNFYRKFVLQAPLRPWSLPTLVILLRRRKSSTGAIPEHFLIILNHYSWYPGFKVLSLDLQEERKPASIGGASYRYSGILKHCSLLNVPELKILYPTLKMISGLVKTTWASLGEVNRMCIRRSPVATFWWLKLDSQAMEK